MLKCVLVGLVVLFVALYAINEISETETVYALVLSRHGDRTPIHKEIARYPNNPTPNSTYYPDGLGALTNSGKRRAYSIGLYLRSRYDGLVSQTYLPDDVRIRATFVERCKMVAMTVAAGLYRPDTIQRWSESLDWQPVPYTMEPEDTDDLEFMSNCARAQVLVKEMLTSNEILAITEVYAEYFPVLTKYSGFPIQSTYDVIMLKGAIDGQISYGIQQPKWVEEQWDILSEIEDTAYGMYFTGTELLQLTVGTMLYNYINVTSSIIAGEEVIPSKLMFLSGHDVNVAPLLAATAYGGSPAPARPGFGATYSLELRRDINSGEYGIAAVYAPNGGYGPFQVLKIAGCGGGDVCPYATFVELISDYVITDYQAACAA